jgi:hypothetical protein
MRHCPSGAGDLATITGMELVRGACLFVAAGFAEIGGGYLVYRWLAPLWTRRRHG